MELIGQIVGMAAVTFGGSLLFSFRRVRNAWTIALFFAYFWVALAVSAGVWFAAHRDQIESVKAGNLPPRLQHHVVLCLSYLSAGLWFRGRRTSRSRHSCCTSSYTCPRTIAEQDGLAGRVLRAGRPPPRGRRKSRFRSSTTVPERGTLVPT